MKVQVEFQEHKSLAKFYVIAFLILTGLLFCVVLARAEAINVERLADAIYKAEGGAKTSHPYGILAHYKHTTPRQACINTINHRLRLWDGKGDFIEFLGSRYCPTQGKHLTNDEKRLNIYWITNVKYFLKKEMSSGQK